MKLLFDQNLSHHLVATLADIYPDSAHVRDLGLERADDRAVWEYARANGLTVVSKDSDFHQLAFLIGPPPKAVWLRLGNCTTEQIEEVLRDRRGDMVAFEEDPVATFLVLDGPHT